MTVDSSTQRIMRLTPLEAIMEIMQSRVTAAAPRTVALSKAAGAVLAYDVEPSQLPRRALALRDGFAVATAEIADAGPYTPAPLSLVARRIDAGDPLPNGTDAVAPLEAIALRGDRAEAIATVAPGEGVLAAGGDATPGTALRRAGEIVRPLDIAAMSAAGIAKVTVRMPRIALARASAAKTAMLDAAYATLVRCIAQNGGVPITQCGLAETLRSGECDAAIGIGGTGTGRRDDAVHDLARLGRVEAHGIAVSPGDTAAFGFTGERPVLLVPGRLDAALAVWLQIGRHLVAKLAGGAIEDRPTVLSLGRKVTSTLGLTELIAMRCSSDSVEPIGAGYLSLTALAHSDGWITVPADSEGFAAGSLVAVNRWP